MAIKRCNYATATGPATVIVTGPVEDWFFCNRFEQRYSTRMCVSRQDRHFSVEEDITTLEEPTTKRKKKRITKLTCSPRCEQGKIIRNQYEELHNEQARRQGVQRRVFRRSAGGGTASTGKQRAQVLQPASGTVSNGVVDQQRVHGAGRRTFGRPTPNGRRTFRRPGNQNNTQKGTN